MIEHCVKADGGDFSKVEMIPSTVTDEVTALSTDQVDSIWIYWAWAGEKCKLAGLDTNYFAFADIDPVFDFYTPVIIANNGVIEDDAEMVQAFMDATRRGYEDCIADPKGAAEILLKAAPSSRRSLWWRARPTSPSSTRRMPRLGVRSTRSVGTPSTSG